MTHAVVEARTVPVVGRKLIWIPSARLRMGSDVHYPEERPARTVDVQGFWIENAPVTNRAFARFVAETDWATTAELAPRVEDYPGALPERLTPASLVFIPTLGPVDLTRPDNWWRYVPGAN